MLDLYRLALRFFVPGFVLATANNFGEVGAGAAVRSSISDAGAHALATAVITHGGHPLYGSEDAVKAAEFIELWKLRGEGAK